MLPTAGAPPFALRPGGRRVEVCSPAEDTRDIAPSYWPVVQHEAPLAGRWRGSQPVPLDKQSPAASFAGEDIGLNTPVREQLDTSWPFREYGANAAEWFTNATSYAFGGHVATVGSMDLRRRVADKDETRAMFVEIEHRVAAAGKRDGLGLCDPTLVECEIGDFVASNGVWVSANPNDPLVLPAPALVETSEAVFGVRSFDRDHNGFGTGPLPLPLFPRSQFPGFASQRGAIYGATARTAGVVLQGELAGIKQGAVPLLPAGARQNTINASNFLDPALRETSFRIELVGDLIVDCGHPPIHAEIHPFRAGLLHVTPPPQDFAGGPQVRRYSLFNWVRRMDKNETLAFDLWPPPRPNGKSKIGHRFLLPTDAAGSGFVCLPWPSASPNRLRCDIAKSDFSYNPGNADVCSDNPRMLPSCATSLAGGLIEVFGQ